MNIHPETARLLSAQRIHELHARAEADRRALEDSEGPPVRSCQSGSLALARPP